MQVAAQTPARLPAAPRGEPTRTCAGCREEAPQRDLVRVVLDESGEVHPELAAKRFGRGAWVHPAAPCVTRAVPAGFARSFRAEVRTEVASFGLRLAEAAERRFSGLLAAGVGARKIALGRTAVEDALERGHVVLLLAATDAASALDGARTRAALAEGRGLAHGTTASLGAAVGRDALGIVAILDGGLATAIRHAIGVAALGADLARATHLPSRRRGSGGAGRPEDR